MSNRIDMQHFEYTVYKLHPKTQVIIAICDRILAENTPDALVQIGKATDLGADHFNMHRDGWDQDRDGEGDDVLLTANTDTNNFVALKKVPKGVIL